MKVKVQLFKVRQLMLQTLAEKVKVALRDVPAPSGAYKIASLLKSGALTGEWVEYRRTAGGGAQQLLRGQISADGNIICHCARCQGQSKVPNSVFEEHAGSKALESDIGRFCSHKDSRVAA
eukprot:gene5561-5798_t